MLCGSHKRVSLAFAVGVLILTLTSVAAAHATTPITFSTPVDVSNDARSSTFNDQHAMAASGSNVYITWRAGGIYFAASHDNGSTWGPNVRISPVSSGNAVHLQKAAANGLNVYVVYLDNSTGNSLVYVRGSHDGGVTFGSPTQISYFHSIEPKIATCGGGVYISWVNSSERAQNGGTGKANQTMFFRASQDYGNTWGPVYNLQSDDGVVASGNEEEVECWANNVYVVYSDWSLGYREVFIRASHDYGVTFLPHADMSTIGGKGNIREPVVAVGGSYVYAYWIYRTSGKSNYQAYVRVSPDNGTTWGPKINMCNDTYNCHEPFMAASGPNGYAVLHEFVGTANTALYLTVTHDGGKTWSQKVNLIPNEQRKSTYGAVSASGSYLFITWADTEGTTSNNWQERFVYSSDYGNTLSPTQDLSNNPSGGAGVVHFGHDERVVASSTTHVYVAWEGTYTSNGKPDVFFTAGQFA